MPDYIRNKLIVTGLSEDVERFVDHIGQVMDFERFIPPPADMFREDLGEKERKECAEKGIPNWYEWQSEHWGTKWNACDCEEVILTHFEHMPYTEAIYRFDTAWSTPEPVIRRIIEDWPELEIDGGYIDEGYEGCGSFSAFQEYCQEGRAA
jgi:hypothetical protein